MPPASRHTHLTYFAEREWFKTVEKIASSFAGWKEFNHNFSQKKKHSKLSAQSPSEWVWVEAEAGGRSRAQEKEKNLAHKRRANLNTQIWLIYGTVQKIQTTNWTTHTRETYCQVHTHWRKFIVPKITTRTAAEIRRSGSSVLCALQWSADFGQRNKSKFGLLVSLVDNFWKMSFFLDSAV